MLSCKVYSVVIRQCNLHFLYCLFLATASNVIGCPPLPGLPSKQWRIRKFRQGWRGDTTYQPRRHLLQTHIINELRRVFFLFSIWCPVVLAEHTNCRDNKIIIYKLVCLNGKVTITTESGTYSATTCLE